ncbi:1,4-dihydroxy-2-naphthoate octaprenyltransferase [Flavobacterium indicum GPTSA100-9 = DSM 17447]|uniref:1,4-dihydroxy-2-naphthoate octaprenyltransferase n=1 Tax=Flavobacterium indicum (strain DSM 17447 / CIP 109464 / GPTSA100-9) TaxID=1094466 RepID=H8XPE4_FLAIG|nr:1,4-dihydroxy-2-naphthoate octaprenyltransferase [Flavobacterium indicum]CCG53218.1 1,4-dihydroxy-2-naphthoate octaprenyltransferase [Flavobacterium indicum GPTSA100-9 = DSM 17447]
MKNWIQAARLRTLPLSVSGILVGSAYAYYQNQFDGIIFTLAILTTLAFQILSNFANDYGDGVKGTDANRVGEKRLVASGEVTSAQMKQAVIVTGLISLLLALSLIFVSFGQDHFLFSLLFLVLGLASIAAAIKYTVGKNAYGYSGFGDVFVFIFFGLVSVLGSNFLFTKTLDWKLILPAIAIGLLSVAVLNLNNMRDIENDKIANKNTLVVKKGLAWAKKYHEVIILVASLSFMLFCTLLRVPLFPILAINIPLIFHLRKIKSAQHYADFEPELKKVALSTFALSLLFWVSLLINNI